MPADMGGFPSAASGTYDFASLPYDYWSRVVLQCGFDGANGSTTFTDVSNSNNAMTPSGTAQISTAGPKYGTGALLLAGAGDRVTLPTSTDFDLGTVYTVEFWIKPNSLASNFGVLHRGFYTSATSTWAGLAFSIRWLTTPAARFYYFATTGADEEFIDVAGAFSTSAWRHIAMVRDGSSGRIYVDGVLSGTKVNLSTPAASTQTLRIGVWDFSTNNEYMTGQLDDVRITKGICRYGPNFTPPPAAFLVGV